MKMKCLFGFIVICLWLLGAIGGVGYSIYCEAWVIAVGVFANAVLAFFKVKEIYKETF